MNDKEFAAKAFQEVSKILPPISDDDCRVILQDWDETDPDQHVAMRLAAELLNTRSNAETISRPEAELPGLPEPAMREVNPYFGTGADPYGTQNLVWYSADQVRTYGQACAEPLANARGDGVGELVEAARRVEKVWRENLGNGSGLHIAMFGSDGAGVQLSRALEKFPPAPGSEVGS